MISSESLWDRDRFSFSSPPSHRAIVALCFLWFSRPGVDQMTTLLSWQLVRIPVVACRDHGSISTPAGYRATKPFFLDRLSSVISCTWTRVAPVFCKDLCLTNRLCTVGKSVTDSIPSLKPPTFRISIYSLFRLFTQHIQLMFRRLSLYVSLNHDLSPVPMPWVASGCYHMASSVTASPASIHCDCFPIRVCSAGFTMSKYPKLTNDLPAQDQVLQTITWTTATCNSPN